jgi:outer membrane cobalamin receptor
MSLNKRKGFLLWLMMAGGVAAAQPVVPPNGRILDTSGEPVAGASVVIIGTSQGVSTDVDGRFELRGRSGMTRLRVSAIGFRTLEGEWVLDAASTQPWVLRLDTEAIDLQAVVVNATSETAELRQRAFNVTGLDLRISRGSSVTLDELLKSSPGVTIRKEGGMGSRIDVALNGLSGRQVRFFLDGLPLDPIGGGQAVADLPPILLERAEVYKGVVPITLGGDALGGAVHLISRSTTGSFTDASVSLGSFGTRKGVFSAQHSTESRYLRLSGHRSVSDNDYRVRVRIPDPVTGTYGSVRNVRRFHDGYESTSVQAEAGWTDRRFADEIRVVVQAGTKEDDVQHAVSLDRVFGRVRTWSHDASTGVNWSKKIGPIDASIRVRQYRQKSGIIDTSAVSYDWLGGWVPKNNPAIAESSWRKTLLEFQDDATLAHAVFTVGGWESAYTLNRLRRVGDDPLSRYPVPFAAPNTLTKQTFATSYKWSAPENRTTATAFLKSHLALGNTTAVDFDGVRTRYRSRTSVPGVGLAFRHTLTSQHSIKSSYERTFRLPDAYEQFGDGLLLLSNPTLRPEKSHNLNIGWVYENIEGSSRMWMEAQGFLRSVEDLIRVDAVGLTAQYVNQRRVRSLGIDVAARYQWNERWSVESTMTYQDLRNASRTEDGRPSYVFGDRIPNIPFLVSTQQLAYSTSRLEVAWSGYFVERYFLKWPSLGAADGKHVIPRQFTQSMRIRLGGDRIHSFTFECHNLTSARVYDQFRLQKPGRSFHLTYRAHLR